MNDDDLKDLLQAAPPPDPNARKRAINLAAAEFQRTQTERQSNPRQGFWQRLRLTSKQTQKEVSPVARSNFKQTLLGASTACVLITGAALWWLSPEQVPDPAHKSDEIELHREFSGPAQQGRGAPASEVDTRQNLAASASDAAAVPAQASRAPQAPLKEELEANSPKRSADAAFEPQRAKAASPQMQFYAATRQSDAVAPPAPAPEHRDRFAQVDGNPVQTPLANPVSTFAADVDTASYSYVRRLLNAGTLPAKDAVRIEEMINYFAYDYPLPASANQPFKPTVRVTDSPWRAGNKLIHIGIKGFDIETEAKPVTHLTFLLDVSGSMNSPAKLPLVKQAMGLLLDTLSPQDTVAIVVYAGAAGEVLAPTPVKDKHLIFNALQQLSAGGSTAGGAGIELAYRLAEQRFAKDAVNRVILATDGDFNVGITSDQALKEFVERKRDSGIYLSVLGFGQGNYQDALMQQLAQNGNGIAAYIDTLSEAQKVLVDEASGTLFPIANDVKLQVEFNPATVAEYRLLGYETRALAREDFNNDKVDAGDIGAGHTVTAIYEITPVGAASGLLDPGRYQPQPPPASGAEYGFLKIRYKLPGEQRSKLLAEPIAISELAIDGSEPLTGIAREVCFATAVAGFAQLLKGGQYTGDYTYDEVIALANRCKGQDLYGYRTEFVQLVRKAKIARAM